MFMNANEVNTFIKWILVHVSAKNRITFHSIINKKKENFSAKL